MSRIRILVLLMLPVCLSCLFVQAESVPVLESYYLRTALLSLEDYKDKHAAERMGEELETLKEARPSLRQPILRLQCYLYSHSFLQERYETVLGQYIETLVEAGSSLAEASGELEEMISHPWHITESKEMTSKERLDAMRSLAEKAIDSGLGPSLLHAGAVLTSSKGVSKAYGKREAFLLEAVREYLAVIGTEELPEDLSQESVRDAIRTWIGERRKLDDATMEKEVDDFVSGLSRLYLGYCQAVLRQGEWARAEPLLERYLGVFSKDDTADIDYERGLFGLIQSACRKVEEGFDCNPGKIEALVSRYEESYGEKATYSLMIEQERSRLAERTGQKGQRR